VTSLGLSSTSDVITFDQNWHHLYSTSAGETFFNPKQAQEMANHSSKKKTKGKRKGGKKNSKVEKPKAIGHVLKILISTHAWAKMT